MRLRPISDALAEHSVMPRAPHPRGLLFLARTERLPLQNAFCDASSLVVTARFYPSSPVNLLAIVRTRTDRPSRLVARITDARLPPAASFHTKIAYPGHHIFGSLPKP